MSNKRDLGEILWSTIPQVSDRDDPPGDPSRRSGLWGWHLIIDGAGCDRDAIRSSALIKHFAKTLVRDIDMVAYGEPIIVDFGSGDKAGFTLVQLIETSNIVGHFANDIDSMFLDVFSCREFEAEDVLKLVNEYFAPKATTHRMITRTPPDVF